MSETPSTELAVPGIFEVVSLDDARAVAVALESLKDLRRQMRLAEAELTRALIYESQRQGTKTLHMEGVKVVLKGGSITTYDAEAIETELREAGMPEDSIRLVVKETVSYVVDGVRAKAAASANPAYAKIIERHKTITEREASATITVKP